MNCRILQGDCREVLKTLPDDSVQTCVTSPPYWGLRDYGVAGQLGLERTPEEYVSKMVAVFREVKRVLRSDGTCWINIGDTYAGSRCGTPGDDFTGRHVLESDVFVKSKREGKRWGGGDVAVPGVKAKDLIGVPWMLAFALRADGWYLRQEIIWLKPNAMPESVTDRCTKSHESIFLLSKSARYFFDADAIKEPVTGNSHSRGSGVNPKAKTPGVNSRIHQDRDPNHSVARKIKQNESFSAAVRGLVDERNKRSVWSVATSPFSEAHFATFPPDLIEPCIKAGCPEGGTVLDPFSGAGTTGVVARRFQRNYIGIELNPEYCAMSEKRIIEDAPLFNTVTTSAAAD